METQELLHRFVLKATNRVVFPSPWETKKLGSEECKARRRKKVLTAAEAGTYFDTVVRPSVSRSQVPSEEMPMEREREEKVDAEGWDGSPANILSVQNKEPHQEQLALPMEWFSCWY